MFSVIDHRESVIVFSDIGFSTGKNCTMLRGILWRENSAACNLYVTI